MIFDNAHYTKLGKSLCNICADVMFTPYRKKRKGKDEKKKKRRKRRRKLEKPKIITICLMHTTSISRLI